MISDIRDQTGCGSYESPFPKHFIPTSTEANSSELADPWSGAQEKPQILLMGLRRSGKSSIQRVVFQKVPPNETLTLSNTQRIEKSELSECSYFRFQILDCPGHINFSNAMFQSISLFSTSCAVIFVIDSQENYMQSSLHLLEIFKYAYEHNMNCKIEVFIHKVDGLSDQKKNDIQREVSQAITSKVDEYLCGRVRNNNLSIGFHLTTIYDHSIFEAFSKVAQKLIPYLDVFEHLLNTFITNSMIDRVFMLDVTSKIYLAADSGSLDMQTYELFCDMLDLMVDLRSIYTPQLGTTEPTFTDETGTTITMTNEKVLYLRGLNDYLALACLMPEECLDKMGLVEYNFKIVRDGLTRIFELGERYTRNELKTAYDALASSDEQKPSQQKQQQQQQQLTSGPEQQLGEGEHDDSLELAEDEEIDDEDEDDDEEEDELDDIDVDEYN